MLKCALCKKAATFLMVAFVMVVFSSMSVMAQAESVDVEDSIALYDLIVSDEAVIGEFIQLPPTFDSPDYFVELIRQFMERRTSALIEPSRRGLTSSFDVPLHISVEPKINMNMSNEFGNFNSSSIVINESVSILSYEKTAFNSLNDLRDVVSQHGTIYVAFDSDLILLSYEISDNVAVISVEMFTRLYFASDAGGPPYTAWYDEREFTFNRMRSGWTMVSHRLLDDTLIRPLNEPPHISREQMAVELQIIGDAESRARGLYERVELERVELESLEMVPFSSGRFNRAAAVNYAREWWNRRNPFFASYDLNCTNFVSQALMAGGWTEVRATFPMFQRQNTRYWWPGHPRDPLLPSSWSFIGVNYFRDFALNNSGRRTVNGSSFLLVIGDVVQTTGWMQHTMIVTTVTADGRAFLTYNTRDTLDAPLAHLIAGNPGLTWHFLLNMGSW